MSIYALSKEFSLGFGNIATAPLAGAEVDLRSALSKGLVFYITPSTTSLELAQGAKISTQSGVINKIGRSGRHIRSPAINDYINYENKVNRHLVNEITIIFYGSLDSSANFGNMLNSAYRADNSWSAPNHAFTLQRDSGTTEARIIGSIGPTTNFFADSAPGFWSFDGSRHFYAVTRSGLSVSFYKDGELFSNSTATNASDFFTDDEAPVNLMVRHSFGQEGVVGDCEIGAVYSRALSPLEISSFYNSPYQMLKSANNQYYFTIGAAPTASLLLNRMMRN